MKTLPKYPIYIPSKGRSDICLTAQCLRSDGVPFWLVVEPQEVAAYADEFGRDCILELPWDNPGSVIPARNWIKAHAQETGLKWHWQIDDNCRRFRRLKKRRRIPVRSGYALAVTEEFMDRYENIAIGGLAYTFFVTPVYATTNPYPPFWLNSHVYSCSLILNETPFEWRGRYNEDTDYCLQALDTGYWCSLQVNIFMVDKATTMSMRGGNTDMLYAGDGRLKMAAELVSRWPQHSRIIYRFGRPQHYVNWEHFQQPLRRLPDVNIEAIRAAGDRDNLVIGANPRYSGKHADWRPNDAQI